jgi:hypothetical protein
VRLSMVALVCAVGLGGCQTGTPADAAGHKVVMNAGDAMVSAVGTPFYLVFKGVVCLASAVIAVPAAAVVVSSESPLAPEARRDLGDGMSQNCGPPYALSPYRVVSTETSPQYRPKPMPEQPPAADPEQATPAGPRPLFPKRGH